MKTAGLRRFALLGAILSALVGLTLLSSSACDPLAQVGESSGAQSYLFCFWNVENFFDDHDDHRTGPGDKEYDGWFARNPDLLRLKLDNLCDALLRLNEGRGPDILALAEVEDVRAAELLQAALNKRIKDPALVYQHVLMKNLNAGRHIAPAIITRLPVRGDKTRLLGQRQRILEGHIVVNGNDLVVLASHWTSRLTDKDGSHRARYADQIYGQFRAMYKSNPHVALLVCGDFNDPPNAESVVQHLHALSDIEKVRAARSEPLLLDLFADTSRFRPPGTLYDSGKWWLFDQIAVSPGMLGGHGWSCDPRSAGIVSTLVRPGDKLSRPWRFGSEHDKAERGYSDHFPVTVRLQVAAGAGRTEE